MSERVSSPAGEPETFRQLSAPRSTAAEREPLPGAPQTERRVLAAAVVVGIVTDVLAVGRPAGVGLTVSLLLGLALVLVLHGRSGLRLPSLNRLAVAGALALLALTFTFRTSPELLAVNSLAIYGGFVLLSVRIESRRLREASVAELAIAVLELPITSAVRAWCLVRRCLRLRRSTEPAEDARFLRRHGHDILVGCAVAVPVLGVFTALLAASDAGFQRIVSHVFDLNLGDAFAHLFNTVWVTLLAVMALVAALASVPVSRVEERRGDWAGPAVVWIVLGSTCALFALFLALQGSYLFGGEAYLERRSGLTAAEYARRGFFELLTVAGLTVALLLGIRASFTSRGDSERVFRWLAPAVALLTIVLLGSAMARLLIYADRFGLTDRRISAVAVLIWIAAVLGWLAGRIARDRDLYLGAFAACTGLVAVLALNAVNPDALSARTNLERRSTGTTDSVDAEYLLSLSDDATPAIIRRIDRLPRAERERVAETLAQRIDQRADGWRSHNLAHERAKRAVEEGGRAGRVE